MLRGKVLVTGGSGFLARALYERARREVWPVEFTSLSRDDHKIASLQRRFPEVRFVNLDIRADIARLSLVLSGHDTVVHAAASKHVDLAEGAAFETLDVNIMGSRNLILAAVHAGVGRVVAISTDKAVAPVNNYGASKFYMERLFQEAGAWGETTFTVVRYGNVVGSTGSIVPRMRDALNRGEALRLTDPNMTRFWMSTDEAINTILWGLEAAPGTVTVPTPRAMSLHGLALVALGYEADRDLPPDRVEIIGLRPGEKIHEQLIGEAESIRTERPRPSVPYYHINRPSPGTVVNAEPFIVSSDRPPGGTMTPAEMATLIREAEAI